MQLGTNELGSHSQGATQGKVQRPKLACTRTATQRARLVSRPPARTLAPQQLLRRRSRDACALRLDETQPPRWPAIGVVAAYVVAEPDGRDGDQQGGKVAHHLPGMLAGFG